MAGYRSSPSCAPGGEEYVFLILDTFSSDSISVHLITLETFEFYRRHLAEGGVLAVHATSLHLDLTPLIHRLGESVGLHAMVVRNLRSNSHYSRGAKSVLLSAEAARLRELETLGVASRKQTRHAEPALRFYSPEPDEPAEVSLWTDDYSDLFGVLKDKPLF